jgi:hypothetical protein
LTAIPENLKLPETVGGWLDLSSLTAIPENLKLPPGCELNLPSHLRRSPRNKR